MSHHSWFQDARFGMFIHWGSYSLKGFEASWPLIYGDIAYADYDALADRFDPQHYDPTAWAALAKATGMRYIVLTTKHHDGFALYDTQLSDYSTPKRAAKRDLIRPYVEAVRAAGLKVGFYLSSISIAERLNKDCCVSSCRGLAWNHTLPSSRSLLCS